MTAKKKQTKTESELERLDIMVNGLRVHLDHVLEANGKLFRMIQEHNNDAKLHQVKVRNDYDEFYRKNKESIGSLQIGIFVCCTLTLIASFAFTYWMTT